LNGEQAQKKVANFSLLPFLSGLNDELISKSYKSVEIGWVEQSPKRKKS
jgi:hypothetical protein